MSSKEIGAWLAQVFTTVFYPTLVIGVFVSILLILLMVVFRFPRLTSIVRCATGALLPLATLVILTATGAVTTTETGEILQHVGSAVQFAVGLLLGAGVMEWSYHVLRADSDGAASVYAISLSALGSWWPHSLELVHPRTGSWRWPPRRIPRPSRWRDNAHGGRTNIGAGVALRSSVIAVTSIEGLRVDVGWLYGGIAAREPYTVVHGLMQPKISERV